jgi:hypothetical protein
LASISFYLIFPNSLKNFSTSLSRVEEEMFPMKTRPEEGIAKELDTKGDLRSKTERDKIESASAAALRRRS